MLQKNFAPFPILLTERLTLRQLAISDDQAIFTLRSDKEINKYLDRPLCHTIDDARNFINKVNENCKIRAALYWAISLKDSNTLAGTICLYGFSDENNSCEIGYELLTSFQGKGIAKEAAKKVIDHAFTIINVETIEATLHRNNQPSIALLEKLSFQKSHMPGNTNPELISYHLINPGYISAKNG